MLEQDVNVLLEQYGKMIKGAAWSASKLWDWEFTELESQGYLIFMEAIKTYDSSYGTNFGTYLFNRLRTLQDYVEREKRIRYQCLLDYYQSSGQTIGHAEQIFLTDYSASTTDFDRFCRALDRLEASIRLSQDAKVLLKYILMGNWDVTGRSTKPTLAHTKKIFKSYGWRPSRTVRAWQEVSQWYEQTA